MGPLGDLVGLGCSRGPSRVWGPWGVLRKMCGEGSQGDPVGFGVLEGPYRVCGSGLSLMRGDSPGCLGVLRGPRGIGVLHGTQQVWGLWGTLRKMGGGGPWGTPWGLECLRDPAGSGVLGCAE